MADRKISDLTALTTPASGDFLPIVDISEAAAASKNKKITYSDFLNNIPTGTITSTMILDGTILNADINASAAIVDTKLATIATGGKVSNSATTATDANTASAIVARDASGNFSAGTITAALTGAASSNVLKAGDTMTGALVVPLASAATPSLTFTGDLDSGVFSPGANQVAVATNGVGRLFVDATGLVGIGTTSPGVSLEVAGPTGDNLIATFRSGDATAANNTGGGFRSISSATAASRVAQVWLDADGADLGGGDYFFIQKNGNSGTVDFSQFSNAAMTFKINATERARIDSSGRLLVGTSTARDKFFNTTYAPVLQIEGTTYPASMSSIVANGTVEPYLIFGRTRAGSIGGTTVVNSGDACGVVSFQGSDGTELVEAASIAAQVDGTPGANDMPGRLVFSTTADGASSPTERMRITQSGNLMVGTTTGSVTNGGLFYFSPVSTSEPRLLLGHATGTGSGAPYVSFFFNAASIGSITQSGTTAVAYNTTSDYRLKENVTAFTDGIARLHQLKPCRFNFIAESERLVDGFLAHEVQTIVPEAITGEKDAVDDDGNPIYQGIDQSKLVPLLTAALQEAIGRIEQLESTVKTLQGA